jgi:para-aminobenzoate synthetase component I
MPISILLDPPPDPLAACEAMAGLPFRTFLDGAAGGKRARFSFLCADPVALLLENASGVQRVDLTTGEARMLPCTGLEAIRAELSRFATEHTAELPPFQGGIAGFLSYELSRKLERLPSWPRDDIGVPDIHMGVYDWVVAWDHEENRAWVISTGIPEEPGARREQRARERAADVMERLDRVRRKDGGSGVMPTSRDVPHNGDSSLSRDGYMAAVERVRSWIRAGDLFQANVTRRIRLPAPDNPWALYLRLRALSPAPFAAFVETPGLTVASASPERFLSLDAQGNVETRPIKGTRPRGASEAEDQRLAAELLASGKDRAENLMIVDLMRNDLSRVCEAGSIRVTELFALERWATVQHLVSAVCGRMREGHGAVDLLEAAFPPGSITGAPKVRAMEVIAEVEPVTRGVYCGSIGYMSLGGAMDMNVAIRTCTIAGGWAWCAAGGGIVLDSDPAEEYAETEDKAGAMLRALAK